jgi:mycothiol synthase
MTVRLPAPDKFPEFTWRPARLSDAPALHRLLEEIEIVDRRDWHLTLEDRERDFQDPTTQPENDSLVAVDPKGEIAAFAWTFAPPVVEKEHYAYIWGEVHPYYRGRGLGSFILEWNEARARQILSSRSDNLPRFIRVSCHDHLQDRIDLFESRSFVRSRYAYRMRRDLSLPIPDVGMPPGIQMIPWRQELDLQTLDAANDAFRDHWGFNPVTVEQWRLWFTGHPGFRPDLTYLAVAEGLDRQEVIGLCLNRVMDESNRPEGVLEGWVQEVAVRRGWRGKGIATALLCASMQAFIANGIRYAGLAVDTENLTGALRIYERLEFEVFQRFITFLKKVG